MKPAAAVPDDSPETQGLARHQPLVSHQPLLPSSSPGIDEDPLSEELLSRSDSDKTGSEGSENEFMYSSVTMNSPLGSSDMEESDQHHDLNDAPNDLSLGPSMAATYIASMLANNNSVHSASSRDQGAEQATDNDCNSEESEADGTENSLKFAVPSQKEAGEDIILPSTLVAFCEGSRVVGVRADLRRRMVRQGYIIDIYSYAIHSCICVTCIHVPK